jgi:cell division protein FtsI (penicillin-binding protein 3)
VAGVEEYFNQQLNSDGAPLVLSIDAGMQGIVRDELAAAIQEFKSPGGCAIVMNARTGEILAMASLPDYDVNSYAQADKQTTQPNQCVNRQYEPGSVFKLQTISMALDSGMIHYWDYFDTTHPLHVGRFTVTDFDPVTTWMAVPQILNVSSNIGASRIATILGPKMQQDWLHKMGFYNRSRVQLPGPAKPTLPRYWGLSASMTVSFGAGISISPLQVITGVLPIVNGGLFYQPTLLAVDPNGPQPVGVRVMQQSTSDMMRKLMTNVVLFGTGVKAAVPGYVVGGKTGTAQVINPHGGGYFKHLNNASFMGVFPMQNPSYVVYVVVFQPHGDASTAGFTTGGQVAAPVVHRIIARIGPMLGVLPSSPTELAALDAALTVPLSPSTPPGAHGLGPGNPLPPGANAFAYQLMGAKPPPVKELADAQP